MKYIENFVIIFGSITIHFHEWKTGFEFFGSPASMYDKHTDEELGIKIHSLNNAFCKLRKENKPLEYVTKTGYIIRKGEIILKETIGKKKTHE